MVKSHAPAHLFVRPVLNHKSNLEKKCASVQLLFFFLPINLNIYVLGAQKNRLIETIFRQPQYMFWLINKKNQFSTMIYRHVSSVGDLQFLCPNISFKHDRYPDCKSSRYDAKEKPKQHYDMEACIFCWRFTVSLSKY